ncbi:uncharacterized protein LOC131508585 [Neofelis nebulosa]|uniref:uncharacterized protein LOC131508585 n=1 Tax=Neofelis nebulosa TaxID=61452 RepID=UPI00272CEA0D|nr:uncharacterized protein LOC131508585 [Neofelis nebulosa]
MPMSGNSWAPVANFWGHRDERGLIGPQTPTRVYSQTVPQASAQLLTLSSLPLALESPERRRPRVRAAPGREREAGPASAAPLGHAPLTTLHTRGGRAVRGRGRRRRQRPGREHSLTGAEGRGSRRLRQRRGSSSSAGSCRCGRLARSIPPNHPPPGPPPAPPQPPQPPLQPPQPPQPRRGSANRREGARARAPAATAHNLRPQLAAQARGGDGRAHAARGGDGPRKARPRPPTHAVAGRESRTLAGDPVLVRMGSSGCKV